MNQDRFSLMSRFRSFRYAFSGLLSLLKYEHNSRIHLLAAIIAIVLGLVLSISCIEWCIIIIVTGLVFICELFNSSVEELADLGNPGPNEKIKRIKDYAAAAVLISALIALAVAAFVFVPKIF